jgi:cellulose synthase/poly-beta-1,6-N-acetylglucosamine synthase-like glycosyltransferase
MTEVLQIFLYSLLIISLIYLVIITVFTIGWFKLKAGFEASTLPDILTTIVVAVRNEEENINSLLKNLTSQLYPHNLLEIIIVDDHSQDGTVKLIEKFISNNPTYNIKLYYSDDEGKKSAIHTGVTKATNNFILVTDGDCLPGKHWVRKMSSYYKKYKPKLLLAPVVYINEKTFFQKLFSLEFISLVASGAGAIGVGIPFMGNGANMGFEKEAFLKTDLRKGYSSGDDVFLIHSIKKEHGKKSIHFLKDVGVVVRTFSVKNLKEFIRQRLRWASKARGYKNIASVITSLSVLLFNIGLFFLFVTAFFYSWLFIVWFLFIFLKTLIDMPLLQGFARLTGKSHLLVFILPLEFVYPFYVTFTGISSLFVRYKWKDRKGLK